MNVFLNGTLKLSGVPSAENQPLLLQPFPDHKTDMEETRKLFKEGQSVFFGRYPQTAEGLTQPIEWTVLSVHEDKALLVSKDVLFTSAYDEKSNTWSKSSLRQLLNNKFFDTAFTSAERAAIVPAKCVEGISICSGGIDATDSIFCLSAAEVEKFFADDESSRAKPSPFTNALKPITKDGFIAWWLRTPGDTETKAAVVDCYWGPAEGSYFYKDGISVRDADNIGVRPALWLNLSLLKPADLNTLLDDWACDRNGWAALQQQPQPGVQFCDYHISGYADACIISIVEYLGICNCSVLPGSIVQFYGDAEGAVYIGKDGKCETLSAEETTLRTAGREALTAALNALDEQEGISHFDLRKYILEQIGMYQAEDIGKFDLALPKDELFEQIKRLGFTPEQVANEAVEYLQHGVHNLWEPLNGVTRTCIRCAINRLAERKETDE